MTQHIGEDALLELALGLLEAEAEGNARHHVDGCAACRTRLQGAERLLREIRNVAPSVQATAPLLPTHVRDRQRWLRAAAMIAVGFGLGFVVSESLRPPATSVVRQQIVPRSPEWPSAEFVTCQEIDLSSGVR